MRELATAGRINAFIDELGRTRAPRSTLYLAGGASAVLVGWRESTIDLDIKLVPESDELLRAIPSLKETLRINVELASPDHFIPVKEGWESRSPFIRDSGILTLRHFEFSAQALGKVERGHPQDLADAREMVARGLVSRPELEEYFNEIRSSLYRFPAVDPVGFEKRVRTFLEEQ